MKAWYKNYKRSSKLERTYNNIVFDSKLEVKHYCLLLLAEKNGYLKDLKIHVQHELILPSGERVLTPKGKTAYYESDFEYYDNEKKSHVIEDCKGFYDRHSQFRIAVFEAVSGKKVVIIR